jgi:hypothetical protein
MARRLTASAIVVVTASVVLATSVITRGGMGHRFSSQNRFVVHEWGTMTSVAGEDGIAVTWRPLSEPSDLPDFIYGTGSPRHRLGPIYDAWPIKASLSGTVRMETPVVYFYAARPITASVKVDFKQGNITEWYPEGDRRQTNLAWNSMQVAPGLTPDFPIDSENTDSRYYTARGTDSAPIRVVASDGPQAEKFLFYRGVGTFDLPLSIELSDDLVSVTSSSDAAPRQAILFENHNCEVKYQIQDLVNNQAVFARSEAGKPGSAIRGDLFSMLVSAGLYPKEARAMINTWGDQWFEEGLRVFYIMPRSTVDSVIPMTIDPAPSETVRVMVCRAELITPEKEATVNDEILNLGDESAKVRESARRALSRQGRFLEPILRRIQDKTDDEAIKTRIDDLIKNLSVKG